MTDQTTASGGAPAPAPQPAPAPAAAPAALTPASVAVANAASAGKAFTARLARLYDAERAAVLKDLGLAQSFEKTHAFMSGLAVGIFGFAGLLGVSFIVRMVLG